MAESKAKYTVEVCRDGEDEPVITKTRELITCGTHQDTLQSPENVASLKIAIPLLKKRGSLPVAVESIWNESKKEDSGLDEEVKGNEFKIRFILCSDESKSDYYLGFLYFHSAENSAAGSASMDVNVKIGSAVASGTGATAHSANETNVAQSITRESHNEKFEGPVGSVSKTIFKGPVTIVNPGTNASDSAVRTPSAEASSCCDRLPDAVKNRRPTGKELNDLSGLIGNKKTWPRLARELGIPDHKCDEIKSNESDNAREQAYQMLAFWIQSKSNAATVAVLCQALSNQKLDDVAEKIFFSKHN